MIAGFSAGVAILITIAVVPATADPRSLWSVPNHGVLAARLVVEAELTRHRAFAPLSVAPDVTFGVAHGLAASLHYSRTSQGELGAGNGVCLLPPRETLGKRDTVCSESETGLALGGLAQIAEHVTAHAGVLVRSPGAFGLELGLAVTARSGRYWAVVSPAVVVGLTGRSRGNRDRAQAPAYGGVAIGSGELHLRSGVEGAFATFRDTYAIPFGAGASVAHNHVRLGADVSLDRALGPLNTRYWRTASAYLETTMGGSR